MPRKRMKRWRALAAGLMFLAVAGFLATVFWIGPAIMVGEKRTAFPAEAASTYTPDKFGLIATEKVLSEESLPAISCFYCTQNALEKSKGTFIILHGVGARKEYMLGAAKAINDRGFDCIVPDMRAHGKSEGEHCTYGYHESQDVTRLIDVYDNGGTPFYVWGTSMGGAVAIISTAQDKRIKGALIESTFSRLDEVANDYFERIVGFRFPWLMDLVMEQSEKQANFDADQVAPEVSCTQIDVPVFMVHGTADKHINVNCAQRNFDALASKHKQLFLVEGATHNNVWATDPDGVSEAMTAFVEEHF